MADLIDVRQAEILVAQAAEAPPEIERQIEQTENVISVLHGRKPDAVPCGRPLLQQIGLPAVPPGVPSSLLEGGVSPYLEVPDSERQAFDAELGLVRALRDELLAVVRLYRALGGGWQE